MSNESWLNFYCCAITFLSSCVCCWGIVFRRLKSMFSLSDDSLMPLDWSPSTSGKTFRNSISKSVFMFELTFYIRVLSSFTACLNRLKLVCLPVLAWFCTSFLAWICARSLAWICFCARFLACICVRFLAWILHLCPAITLDGLARPPRLGRLHLTILSPSSVLDLSLSVVSTSPPAVLD